MAAGSRSENVYVAVIGPGTSATEEELETAYEVGKALARNGHVVLTGGLDGVMAAACRGAQEAGGITVGLLPGMDRGAGNPYLTVALGTGLGELRNGMLIRVSEVVICVGSSWGTLSEVALAARTGVPVVIVGDWSMPTGGVLTAGTVAAALEAAGL